MIVFGVYDSDASNTGGGSNVAWLYLDDTPNIKHHKTHVLVPYIYNGSPRYDYPFVCEFFVTEDKKTFTNFMFYEGNVQSGDYYYVSKIIGYK